MNRIHIIILSVLIMLGFPACVETLQEPDSAGKLYLNLHSTICSTKVSVQETSSGTYMAFWKNGESSTVIMDHSDGYQDVEGTVTSEDSRWANLAVAFDSYPQSNSYTYYSVIPASNYRGYKDGTISVYVPSEQSPSGYSFDSSASVLIGRSEVFSVQPGGDQDNPQDINMSFNFATAFGKCSVTGYPEGERLLQINIISETQALCGRADLNEDGELSFIDEENKLVVNVCNSNNIWFASYPGEHECWYVEALTERGIYTKKISKKLVLKTGIVAEFSVDMTGAAFAEHEPIRYAKSLTPSTDIDYISVYGGADIQGTLVKGIWYWNERGAEYVFDDVPGIGAYRLSIATYYWVNEDTSIGVSVNGSDLTSYTILSTEHNAGNYTLVIDDVFLVKGRNTIKITNGDYMGADPNANPWYPNIGTVTVSNDHNFPQLNLSKSTLEFTYKGGTETVEAVLLNSTEPISAVSSKPEYASVSVVGNEITVTVIENTLYESLNAEITVTAGDLIQTLYVIQTGAPESMVPYTSSLVPGGENVEVFGGADIQGTLVKGIWYWTERGAEYVFDDVPAGGAYRLSIATYYWVNEDTSIGVSVNGSAVKSYTILATEHNAGNYTVVIDNVFLNKGVNTIKVTKGDYLGTDPNANPYYPNVGMITITNNY